ncbi:MAG: ATP phosphoribosyltransferase [Myxococcales bacterium]|nr:ATP phosphoribosyltransferase [Myxococcales bacterium]
MTLRVALPKGRMQSGVFKLLEDSGIAVTATSRGYRPLLAGLDTADVKILKPQNIAGMLAAGSRDLGFAGADWVAELDAHVVEVVDTGLDPVRIVAAAPDDLLVGGALPSRPLVIASEFERITRGWIARERLDARFFRTYGATEVFPPEDADCIVDVAQSGATLRANALSVVAELMRSSTRLYASEAAMADPAKRAAIETLGLLLRSVLDARGRVLLEVNVAPDHLAELIAILPCMKTPTVAELHGGSGYAVKVAVPRDVLPSLIPKVRARGGTDLVVSPVSQLVP